MKDTIFLKQGFAKLVIIVVLINFIFFTGMLVVSTIEGDWMLALFSLFFVLFSLATYFVYRKKGFIDRARIHAKGITILRGFKKEIVFIPWNQVNEIKIIKHPLPEKLRVRSGVIVDGKNYVIDIDQCYETDYLISKYFYSGN